MTQEGKDYNGNTAILEELGALLREEDSIPVNAAIRVMLKAMQHQIKVTHDNKIAADQRISTIDAEVKSKLSSKHAYTFGLVIFGLDRSGAIDMVLNWLKTEGGLFLKLLFGL